MALKCTNCKKGVMYGHNVSHSKRRTKRVFKPNLHTARLTIGGVTKRHKVCTKCLRALKKKPTKLNEEPKVEEKTKPKEEAITKESTA